MSARRSKSCAQRPGTACTCVCSRPCGSDVCRPNGRTSVLKRDRPCGALDAVALGRDADGGGEVRRIRHAGPAGLTRREKRAERHADPVVPSRRVLALLDAGGTHRYRIAPGARAESGAGCRARVHAEVGLVLRAARHGADGPDPRLADARVARTGSGARPDALGDRLHPARGGARGPGHQRGAGHSRSAVRADEES